MEREPILVFQMGKVGSSSVAEALSALGLPVFHLHMLNQKEIDRLTNSFAKRKLDAPWHIQQSLKVKAEFLDKGRPVKIITAVRDPVARNISAYFQNLHFLRTLKPEFEENELMAMMDQFLKRYLHDIPLIWFDREIRDVLGVDVYNHPFPKNNGVQRIQENGMDILLLKTEAPDDIKVSALREFLQISEFSLEAKNVGTEKAYKHYYQAFLNHIHLPEAYLNKMYESRYAQHFYTPEEIGKFRKHWTRQPEPIFVYQMGKVGSSSVAHALKAIGFPIYHAHALNQKSIDQIIERCQSRGIRLPPHIQQACQVRRELIETERPVRIITAVRDPIARNISAYFENLRFFREQKQEFDEDELTAMLDQFLAEYSHALPLGWFDREMNSVFGLDVYRYPFPKSKGVQRIQEKGRDILILKAEMEDEVKVNAIKEFVGVTELSLDPKNVAANKSYKHYYSVFLNRLHLPEDYINKMYESRYAQHFYSPEEISRFRDRWIRDRNSSEKGEIPRNVS